MPVDTAKLRRFVFKLSFAPLGRERSTRDFERFFGLPTPTALGDVANLTPGNFAVVARQLRWRPTADPLEIASRLEVEASGKSAASRQIDF